jgi:hypothetical protein
MFLKFWTKPKLFHVFQLFSKSKTFLFHPTIPKHLHLVHKFLKQNRTFCSLQKNFQLNKSIAFGPNFEICKRTFWFNKFCFKNECNRFFWDISRKMKANNLEITLLLTSNHFLWIFYKVKHMGYCAVDAVIWAEQQLVAIPGFYCQERENKMTTQAIPPTPQGGFTWENSMFVNGAYSGQRVTRPC